MERHIGLWKEEHGEKSTVAELIIDGNHIEFYSDERNSWHRAALMRCQPS